MSSYIFIRTSNLFFLFFKAHVLWYLVTTTQWQNLLISLDKFVSIFFPIWYNQKIKTSMAYTSSSLLAVNVILSTCIPIQFGWLILPKTNSDGSACVFFDVLYGEAHWSQLVWMILLLLYTAGIPLTLSCILTLAVYCRHKDSQNVSRSYLPFGFHRKLYALQDKCVKLPLCVSLLNLTPNECLILYSNE